MSKVNTINFVFSHVQSHLLWIMNLIVTGWQMEERRLWVKAFRSFCAIAVLFLKTAFSRYHIRFLKEFVILYLSRSPRPKHIADDLCSSISQDDSLVPTDINGFKQYDSKNCSVHLLSFAILRNDYTHRLDNATETLDKLLAVFLRSLEKYGIGFE